MLHPQQEWEYRKKLIQDIVADSPVIPNDMAFLQAYSDLANQKHPELCTEESGLALRDGKPVYLHAYEELRQDCALAAKKRSLLAGRDYKYNQSLVEQMQKISALAGKLIPSGEDYPTFMGNLRDKEMRDVGAVITEQFRGRCTNPYIHDIYQGYMGTSSVALAALALLPPGHEYLYREDGSPYGSGMELTREMWGGAKPMRLVLEATQEACRALTANNRGQGQPS